MLTRLIFVFCAAGALYYYYRHETPTAIALKGIQLETSTQDSAEICKNSKGCIGVYIAPWCSACHSSIPLINELLAAGNSDNNKFVVVIGSDEPQALRQFSSELSAPVFLDTQDKFLNATAYSSVPRWFVINSKQEIIDSFTLWYMPDGSAQEKLAYLMQKYANFN